MSTPIDTIPARILVQVRDGVPNELATFSLPVFETVPLAEDDPDRIVGAKVAHKIDSRNLIAGLAEAQRKLVQHLRTGGDFERNIQWLDDLHEWVMSA